MDLRQQILDAAAGLFQTEGVNFTMQQVAASLRISKKTIYTVYPDKEALLMEMVDMLFEKIHRRKAELAALPEPLEVRLQAMIIALPEEYAAMDFRHLETGWEPTMRLLEQGITEGRIRPVNLSVLRRVITAAFEQLLSGGEEGTSYAAELDAMMDILMNGMKERTL